MENPGRTGPDTTGFTSGVNTRNNATFSLGNDDVQIGGTTYKRLEKGSSVLYDKIDGEWLVHEMSDYEPQFTGAGPAK